MMQVALAGNSCLARVISKHAKLSNWRPSRWGNMIEESKVFEHPLQPPTNVGLPPGLDLSNPVTGEPMAMKERIAFATLALQHVQELNARADSKAYLVLTANGFLITFLGWMAASVQKVWQQPLSLGLAAHIAATGALVLTVAISLSHAFKVIVPRMKQADPVTHKQDHGSHMHPASLLFFVDIVKAYHADQEYARALLNATPEDMIANLASSIYGSSVSAQEKYREAHRSIAALRRVLIAWVIFVGLTFSLG